MSMGEGLITNLHTLELFFRFCRRYRIEDRERRILLMRELVARHKAQYVAHPKEFLQGKNIVKFEYKGDS